MKDTLGLIYPEGWKDYELLDVGNFEKLERFGQVITIRPEPQAVWERVLSEKEWLNKANVKFEGMNSSSGKWNALKPTPDNWTIGYQKGKLSVKFNLALTKFKHVGVFPEQSVNWDFIFEKTTTIAQKQKETPKILNLFAYTGGSSLAARAAGAEVYHIDSIKQVVSWANRNMLSSQLKDIRWVVEDAVKFVKRECRRGRKYQGIILDPPAFGHGPNGESWKLESMINELLGEVISLLDPEQHFLVLNTYSLGFSALIVENLINSQLAKQSLETDEKQFGELYIPSTSGPRLPLGVFCRMAKI